MNNTRIDYGSLPIMGLSETIALSDKKAEPEENLKPEDVHYGLISPTLYQKEFSRGFKLEERPIFAHDLLPIRDLSTPCKRCGKKISLVASMVATIASMVATIDGKNANQGGCRVDPRLGDIMPTLVKHLMAKGTITYVTKSHQEALAAMDAFQETLYNLIPMIQRSGRYTNTSIILNQSGSIDFRTAGTNGSANLHSQIVILQDPQRWENGELEKALYIAAPLNGYTCTYELKDGVVGKRYERREEFGAFPHPAATIPTSTPAPAETAGRDNQFMKLAFQLKELAKKDDLVAAILNGRNPCNEVKLGTHELPRCVCDIKDLMTDGHKAGCPEKKNG